MKSKFEKRIEKLKKAGINFEIKEVDEETAKFMFNHRKRLYDTMPADQNPDYEYYTLNGDRTTRLKLYNGGVVNFKIKHIPSGDTIVYKDCCPYYDQNYAQMQGLVTHERYKINMPSFDIQYACKLNKGELQPDNEASLYFEQKNIATSDISPDDIAQMRTDLKRSWHERPDGIIQLVSEERHRRFTHPGGVSEAKYKWDMAHRADTLQTITVQRANTLLNNVKQKNQSNKIASSNLHWGKIITSIIAVLVVLALIVGVVVLLAKVLPPVFEAIGNFFYEVGQFFVNMWNGICNFFSNIGRFFVNLWNGITNFFKGTFSGGQKLEFDTLDNGETYYVVNIRRTMWGNNKDNYIEIPETYNGSPVVGIGENAFANNVYLVELHIPSSIEWIETNAFNDCEVTELYIEDIEAWVKIDFRRAENEADGACYSHPLNYFDNRTKDYTNINFIYLNGEKIHELVIPSSVTEISDYAFYNFTGIDKFVIHDGVSKIGENAFARNYIRNEYHITETKPYDGYWDITFDGTMSKWREITEDMAFSANQGVYCDDGMVAYDYYCYSNFELDYYYDDLREIIEDYWN